MDGRKILLDCGWDDHMDVQALEPLRRIAPQVDAVLISHPDTAHLGALPYAFGTLGMACKVYATLPVHKMGMMFMYDQFLARAAEGDFNLFSLDDVDRAFGAFVPVRYAQHSALDFPTRADSRVDGRAETANETKTSSGAEGGSEDASDERPGAKKNESVSGAKYAPSGITVTAYAAGHTLGGAVWKLHKDAEDIVYAVDYNHRREKHLNGTTLDSINRPSLLITDAFNALGEPTPKTRDDDLMRAVLRAVRSDGNVLIPVDPAGRVLELLLLLEERWAKQQLGAYQLVLLTTVAYNTMEFARSHLEWMGENVGRNFDRDRLNAFNTRYLTLCHSLEELRNLRPGPKVVLASFGSLEAGPARALFAEWAEDPKNLVVLADRGAPGSLSRRVRALAEQPPGARKPLEVRVSRRVLLEGAELEAWRLKRKDERLSKQARLIAEEKAREEEAEKEKEKLPSEETMEVDDETQTGAIQEPAAAAAAESLLGVAQISGADTRAAELRRRRCLIDGFEVPADAAAPVFPDEVWDPIVDDFGEAVDTDAFARAVALSARAAGASDAAIAQAEGAAKAAADAAGAAKAAAQPKAIRMAFGCAAAFAAPAASAAAFAAPSACAMAASEAPAARAESATARAKASVSTASPKSSTIGSQTSSGNTGAAASAGTSNPSIKHRRRRSSAARVSAPEICATPRSDSAAAAAAGSWIAPVWVSSSTSIVSSDGSFSFSFSASSSRAFSSAISRACLLRRSSLRFRRHASSSAPSKSTRRETRTSSGFRAPGGCSASARTRRDRLPGAPRSASTTRFLGSSAHSAKSARAGPASRDPNEASTTFGPGLKFRSSSSEWHSVRYRVLNALRRSRSKLRPTFSPIHSRCERANSMVLYATVVRSTSWYAPSCCLAQRSSSSSRSSSTRPAGSTGMSTFPSERTARKTARIRSSSLVFGVGSPRALNASVMSRDGRLIESSVVPFRCFSLL